jgi:hypothetical protein
MRRFSPILHSITGKSFRFTQPPGVSLCSYAWMEHAVRRIYLQQQIDTLAGSTMGIPFAPLAEIFRPGRSITLDREN